jgi:hypothetical protein
MREGSTAPRRKRGLTAVLVVSALAGAGLLSALSPSPAFACSPTTNLDGSKTCSGPSFSDVPCPAATGSGNAVTAFAVQFIPGDATVISHLLSIVPGCQNATVVESFDPNAPSPSPPTGEKTAKDSYTITCNTLPCGPGTNPTTTFSVTFTQPTGGGGGGGGASTPKSPPPATAVILPGKVLVDPATGKAVIDLRFTPEPDEYDLSDMVIIILTNGGLKPEERAALAAKSKKVNIGSLANTHVAAGQTSAQIPLQLNGKGRKALRGSGTLHVTIRATLGNSAGSTPFSGKLKLVAKKSKKKPHAVA